jgi:alpha-L-fucosidase
MLNVPLPNSGRPDDDELKVVEGITQWMAVNGDAIYGTRPWKLAGNAAPPAGRGEAGFNERNRKDLTAADIRFTSKNGAVFAFLMGWPEGPSASITQLALGGKLGVGKIRRVELFGHKGNIQFKQNETALSIELPREKPCDHAIAFRVEGA